MVKKSSITESDIRNIADSANIFKKGRGYYHYGHVSSFEIKDNFISAKVQGASLYNVRVNLSDLTKSRCNCPYSGSICKHIIAVLFKFLYNSAERDLHSEEGEQKSIKDIFLNRLQFEDIVKTNKPEQIFGAFEIVNRSFISLKTNSDDEITAQIGESGEIITTLKLTYFFSEPSLIETCNCHSRNYMEPCVHILALKIFLLNKLKHNSIPLGFKRRFMAELNKKRYKDFISFLSFDSPIQEKDERYKKYGLLFSIKKDNGIIFYVNKAQVLQEGTLGSPTAVSRNFVRDRYKFFSRHEKRIFDLIFSSIYDDYYGTKEAILKLDDYYKRSKCQETLEYLREAYSKLPSQFIDCDFPEQKAVIDIVFSYKNNEPNSRSIVLNPLLRIADKTTNINKESVIIFGEDKPWAYICPNIEGFTENKGILVELGEPSCRFTKEILNYSGIEFSESFLEKILSKNYLKLSEMGNLVLPEEHEILILEGIKPRPALYLENGNPSFYIKLKFMYGDHGTVSYNSNSDIIFRDEQRKLIRIKRDFEEEKKIINSLLNNQTCSEEGIFSPISSPLEWLVDTAPKLVALGFDIYGKESLKYQILGDRPKFFLNVSSGIDWFDLEADISFGKEKVGLIDFLEAIENHETFIKLNNGKIGVIPKEWISKLAGLTGFLKKENNQGKVRALTSQIEIVESLFELSDKFSADKKYNEIKEKFKKFQGISEYSLPKGLKGELRNYQRAGYNWLNFLREFSFGGCLADEMGLGKTIQVLALLLKEKETNRKKHSLIVVPKSLIFNWIAEIKKFTPSLSYYVHHGGERRKNLKEEASDVIITTYGTLRRDINLLKNKNFHYIILDESQNIKNFSSKNALCTYKLKGRYRLALTGTPIENNYFDLWSQFLFLNPGFLGSRHYFKDKFLDAENSENVSEKVSKLKRMITPFVLMRKKNMVAKELPEKQIITHYCEMENEQREAYEALKKKYRLEIKESIEANGFMKSRFKILEGLLRLRQACNSPKLITEDFNCSSIKIEILITKLKELIGGGHKVLIFSSFVKMLNLVRKRLILEGINFSYLDGKTNNREEIVNEFQNNKDISAFLISIKAGGFGLNLTAADYVFIIDPWWNPAVEMQAIDRTHRIGQENKVFVYKLIAKDTIEEKILELQEKKKDAVEKVLSCDEDFFKKLTPETINYLLS